MSASDVTVDFPVVMQRIRTLLDRWCSGALDHYEHTERLAYVHGRARFDGLEFAQIYARRGAAVTVIEPSGHLIGREDPEISEAVADLLVGEGIRLCLGMEPTSVRSEGSDPADGGGDVVVSLADGTEVRGAALLVAARRRPNTDDLGLDTVGVEVDDHGYVVVDDVFRSTAPGVYAVGDVNGRGAFTPHTRITRSSSTTRATDRAPLPDAVPPNALFTDPPLGRVGMSEGEARRAGHRVRTTTMPAADITLAALEAETTGLVKLVVDDDSDELLGVAALCLHGDELVSTFSAFMHSGASLQQMQEWLPIHPTISEFVPTLVSPVSADVHESGRA